MKVKTLFQCSICGAEYEDEKDCLECEMDLHAQPMKIEKLYFKRRAIFPDKFTVRFESKSGKREMEYIADPKGGRKTLYHSEADWLEAEYTRHGN